MDLGTAIYFGATSVVTLGFGDVVPVGGPARLVVAAAALSGLGVVALVITFLFSLFASYQRREVAVVTLQAKAGAPSSAVVLLESLARLELVDHLPDFFGGWERWIAEVLDSHVAYPLLGFFRSSHDGVSWISALGTVLDTASLVVTTVEGVPRGQAELVKKMGAHLVEDITNLGFRTEGSDGVDRDSFDAVHERLAAAGYRLVPADAGVAGVQPGAGDLRRGAGRDGSVLGGVRGSVVRRKPCLASGDAARPATRHRRRRGQAERRGCHTARLRWAVTAAGRPRRSISRCHVSKRGWCYP